MSSRKLIYIVIKTSILFSYKDKTKFKEGGTTHDLGEVGESSNIIYFMSGT